MLNVFIGAGASVDFGMPLVKKFTNIFQANILKRLDTNLFNFHGQAIIKDKFKKLIERDDLNYEEMIKHLELWMLSEKGENYQALHGLVIQAIECVHLLLLEIQYKSLFNMAFKFQECSGINNLLEQHGLVNIFSLNHDVMTEELCNYYHIKFKDGFRQNIDHNYTSIGKFRVATKDEFTKHKLDLFNPKEKGINILKLHGALDIFAVEDKEKYLKTDSAGFGGCVAAIREIERKSLDYCQRTGGRGVNELFIEDDARELQFFRRSLLSGGHKFTGKFEQIAPIGLFEEFKIRIHDSEKLVIIGYGFGDEHINQIILNFLDTNNKAKIIICDPYREIIPEFMSNFKLNIEIRRQGLIGYLNSYLV